MGPDDEPMIREKNMEQKNLMRLSMALRATLPRRPDGRLAEGKVAVDQHEDHRKRKQVDATLLAKSKGKLMSGKKNRLFIIEKKNVPFSYLQASNSNSESVE